MKNRMHYKRYWVDRQGQKHLISTMSDTHLFNTIKMLERAAYSQASDCPFPIFQGEMAQECAENDFHAMNEDPIEYFLGGTVYDTLIAEAYKRGLKL